ncbi:MAG: hypothetical protein H6597_00645 [Flavobacteriales bacterium]|nr:hypothetical protein [Flavobacteriales bacterium]
MDQKRTKGRITGAAQLVGSRQQALDGFIHAPHHAEHVSELNGVRYVNDSKATFLDATLRSMSEVPGRLVWITGALPAGHGSEDVVAYLRERVKAVVHFGTDPGDAMNRSFGDDLYLADDLRTAVFLAHELAAVGDVVLFSPACPSGNGFANYEERGHAFKQAVSDL